MAEKKPPRHHSLSVAADTAKSVGGWFAKLPGKYKDFLQDESVPIIDRVQSVGDIVGVVPFAGDLVDLASGVVDFAQAGTAGVKGALEDDPEKKAEHYSRMRGELVEGGLRTAAAIPIVGDLATKGYKVGRGVRAAGNVVNRAGLTTGRGRLAAQTVPAAGVFAYEFANALSNPEEGSDADREARINAEVERRYAQNQNQGRIDAYSRATNFGMDPDDLGPSPAAWRMNPDTGEAEMLVSDEEFERGGYRVSSRPDPSPDPAPKAAAKNELAPEDIAFGSEGAAPSEKLEDIAKASGLLPSEAIEMLSNRDLSGESARFPTVDPAAAAEERSAMIAESTEPIYATLENMQNISDVAGEIKQRQGTTLDMWEG